MEQAALRVPTPRASKGLQAWLLVDGARLLATQDGRVIWLNEAAQSLLSGSSCLALEDGLLTSLPDGSWPRFPDLLADIGDDAEVLAACDARGEPQLVISVRMIGSGSRRLCGLSMRAVRDRPLLSSSLLRQVFALTGAEQAIVLSMMAGDTAEAIAHKGSQSMDTIRTHIKHIYAKMQINSREAMFSRLIRLMD